jgi:hypothetical protein
MENKNRVRRFTFNLHYNLEKGITLDRIIHDFSNGWNIDYMVVGQENTNEKNINHIQGYIEFVNATTWDQCRERFISLYGFVSDLQVSKADQESNYNYCSKSGNFKEYGTRSIKLRIDDVAVNVITLLRNGITLVDIMTENKGYSMFIIKNYRNLQVIEKEIKYERKGINIEPKDLPF